MLIARLIADPADLETRLDVASQELERRGMPIAAAAMLDFCGDVLQISLPEGDAGVLREVFDTHFGPTDGLIAQDTIAVPHLFVSDMDSTMIGQECIDELADYAGLKDQIAGITERAMQGELDFEAALRERVGLLAGLDETAIERCLAERIEPSTGAATLVATLKSKGCHTVLVTGGFHHFADPVAERIGFERVVGNRLAVGEGALTGELAAAVVDSETKLDTLRAEAERLGQDAITMAAGDGANDIPMIDAADYGFAYRAKPKARTAANGWIDRGDLTAILKLLAIPESEWVRA
ncbi:phosphoserine phosphatase SerB [Erythrobacter sp. LQ02-29]|uniref:phosphoserine phosphatase SerB n=1 Tax=Erythrobacter sp. LQ02-29 TaxID=2920384 RepID=UPI001F4DD2B6|nr:phosphoserine phosphatase SerB [Erythrobacter sp. LQ02-29]MCP9223094.1 phosphoserine phosphatase SerB [Erythrobacter sp. LQ02-29]